MSIYKKKIESKFGQNFLNQEIIEYGTKTHSKVQDAHEANRPTNPEKENISGVNDEKKLYNAGTFQIVGSALNICPESIPKKIKKDYEKRVNQLVKERKK